jgi:hypothetical protein
VNEKGFNMSEEKRSFSDLVSEAPLARNEGTISLVGALARSHESGKFVLALCAERSVTISIDAVREYRVLGGAVGQLLVQVEVDRDKVPRETLGELTGALAGFAGLKARQDVPKYPVFDAPVQKPIVEATGTLAENVVNPGYGGDPYQRFGGAGPFALVTPHHAPAGVLGGVMGGGSHFTIAICDPTPPPPPPATHPLVDNPPTYIAGLPYPLD